jgi:hypothetical protein
MEERGMGIGESLLIHNINHMYGATGGGREQKKETAIRLDKRELGNYETIKRTLVSLELKKR